MITTLSETYQAQNFESLGISSKFIGEEDNNRNPVLEMEDNCDF